MTMTRTLMLCLLTASAAVTALPSASAVSVPPDVEVQIRLDPVYELLGLEPCTDTMRSETGYFAGVAVTQIIQNEPTDPSSYVSDGGYFAGNELQVIGRWVDCTTN